MRSQYRALHYSASRGKNVLEKNKNVKNVKKRGQNKKRLKTLNKQR